MSEKFTLFYSGPGSQWFPSDFVIDGFVYNCAEQFMMAEKARLFGDGDALEIIMNTNNPKVQKATGRTVQNFSEYIWLNSAKDIVYRGNWAKFTQNAELRSWLVGTAGTTLVEASPYDVLWGIGLGENDPRALDRSQWRGQNWLGEVLTQVREDWITKYVGIGLATPYFGDGFQ